MNPESFTVKNGFQAVFNGMAASFLSLMRISSKARKTTTEKDKAADWMVYLFVPLAHAAFNLFAVSSETVGDVKDVWQRLLVTCAFGSVLGMLLFSIAATVRKRTAVAKKKERKGKNSTVAFLKEAAAYLGIFLLVGLFNEATIFDFDSRTA